MDNNQKGANQGSFGQMADKEKSIDNKNEAKAPSEDKKDPKADNADSIKKAS